MGHGQRRWGWHELDRTWADRLVATADVRPGDLVLDIGAGRGAITAALLGAGASVVAVELHPGRAAHLRQRFGDDDVVVVQVDARDLRLPRRPFRVVANPPYGATNAVVRRLLAPGSRLRAAHIVAQAQVVGRWAGPGAPGAGRWARTFAVGAGGGVPRSAFRPPPRVDSRLLVIERREPSPGRRRGVGARSGPGRGRGRPGPR